MKNLFFYSFILMTNLSYSQNIINLNSPDASTKTYVARDEINILPGYSYKPIGSHKMHGYIDPLNFGNTAYGNLFTNTTFNAITINTSLPVGKIDGSASVLPNGSANYGIPIPLPSGTHSLIPSLAVVYNSFAGNGMMGVGWNLGGLSEISVDQKRKYYDDQVMPIQEAITNNYMLDGNRLMAVNGTYGQDNTIYKGETENFSRVISHGNYPFGPAWFTVETKEGMILEYGKSGNSTMMSNGRDGLTILSWKINKISDQFGNYIEFNYKNVGADIWINQIKYTGNETNQVLPYNEIQFFYSDRTDENFVSIANTEIDIHYLLTKIIIKAEGEIFKTIEFKYAQNLYSLLQEVKEIGADGTALNSTYFKYEDPAPVCTVESTSSFTGQQGFELMQARDFNGDGISDVLRCDWTFVNNTKVYTFWRAMICDGNNNFSLYASGEIPAGYNVYNELRNHDKISKMATTLDFFGDGKDDILLYGADFNNGSGYLSGLQLVNIIDNNGLITTQTVDLIGAEFIGEVSGKFLLTGDFDGDGRDNILLFRKQAQNGYFPSIIRFDGPSASFVHGYGMANLAMNYIPNALKILTIDMNGDGKTEVMAFFEHSCEVFEINQEGDIYTPTFIYNSRDPGFPTASNSTFIGDFNGDGKSDLLNSADNVNWTVSYSMGNEFMSANFYFDQAIDIANDKLKIADYNGDGKSDILQMKRNSSSNSYTANMYFSTGETFVKESTQHNGSLSLIDLISGDFNGDGKVDEINRFYVASDAPIFYWKKNSKELLLQKVRNGFGNEISFQYKYLSRDPDYRKNQPQKKYPYNEFQAALPVTASLTMPNGIGGVQSLTYTYEGGLLHRAGKGFLGFKKFAVKNNTLGFITIYENELNLLKSVYVPKMEKVYLAVDFSVLSQKEYFNTVVDLGNLRYWIKNDKMIASDFITGITSTITNTFDNFGNPTLINEENNAGYKVTTNTFSTFGNWWIASRISSVKTDEVIYPNAAAYHRESNFTFGTKGQLLSSVSDPNDAKKVSSQYQYDSFGNITKSETSATGLASITEQTIYDDKGRFPIKSINNLGQSTTTQFDKKWSSPLTVTGLDGLSSTFIYDGFGKLKKAINAQNISSSTTFSWDISTNNSTSPTSPSNTLYKQTTSSQGSPTSHTWYDQLGREVKALTQGQNLDVVSVQKMDAKGNLLSKTSPYADGQIADALISTYQYDYLNRIVKITSPNDVTNYIYSFANGTSTTAVSNSLGNSSQTVNALGLVLSSTDQGGTLHYTYLNNKKLSEVKLGTTVVSSSEYDLQGRQTKLIDMNAGTSLYQYDAYGRIISQTDAKGITTSFQYDTKGQLITKIANELVTSMEYVSSGNGINQLKSIRNSTQIAFEYEYDPYSRLIKESKIVDGQTFVSTMTYDNLDQNTSITYPSGLVINMEYDSKGYLSKVKHLASNTDLFNNSEQDAFGNYKKFTLGNGKTTLNKFNKYGLPEEFKTINVQWLKYSYDAQKLLLTSKTDQLNSLKENYLYDAVNRLKQAKTTNLNGNISYNLINTNFSPNGNIAFKTDIGEYDYDANKKNAVVKVKNEQQLISPNLQEISYNGVDRVENIKENGFSLDFVYDPADNRIKTEMKLNNQVIKTKYYLSSYEKEIDLQNNRTREIHYLPTGNVAYVIENGVGSFYYLYKDHLGSVTTLTNATGQIVAKQSFDAWGRQNNPNTGTYSNIPPVPSWVRGYTGHEMLPEFDLVNMNNRLYDPKLARMLAVDNFVQAPYSTQSYNRYSYAWNNPVAFNDPSGEFVGAAIVVGAVIGMYSGGVLANGSLNPRDWEANKRTAGYMLGGAIVGAVSGAVGGAIAASGSAFSNTMGIVASSTFNSLGTAIYTGGQADVSINFGFASYNASQEEWGWIGKKGNSIVDNIGYTFGAMANLQDLVAGWSGTSYTIKARKEVAGHSEGGGSYDNRDILISVGPICVDCKDFNNGLQWEAQFIYKWPDARNVSFIKAGDSHFSHTLRNVNGNLLATMTENLNAKHNLLGFGKFKYSVLRGCVNYTSRSLLYAGVVNINAFLPITAPVLLNAELFVRQMGIFASPFIVNRNF